MKEFSENGFTVVFYQKENDKKFSFKIKNEPELTEQLLRSVKTKRVKEKDIYYARKGISEKLENLSLLTAKKPEIMENQNQNPITVLAEKIQALYGQNIETEVLGKTGADHNPTVTVAIYLPNGHEYTASGGNKRIAKRKAAEKALRDEKF